MDERDAERETRRDAAADGKPGRVILFGAAAMVFGAVIAVTVLRTYFRLAGQAPEADTPELSALRSPDMQFNLWITLVESAFLAVCGVGVTRMREWARTLFLALAVVRLGVFAMHVSTGVVDGSAESLVLALLRTVVLYGGGAWFLTRPGIAAMFRPAEE